MPESTALEAEPDNFEARSHVDPPYYCVLLVRNSGARSRLRSIHDTPRDPSPAEAREVAELGMEAGTAAQSLTRM